MNLSIRERPDHTIVAMVRIEGGSGRTGDMTLEVAPGQVVGGIPYHVWHRHVGETVPLDTLRRYAEALTHA